ncbi:MAG: hypothetical protein KFB95_06195 [Simkaniaceae bacterium]|nr:MAG: hypothetical protein KFB95_06195 [Simkaniaceae bacterium]
MEQARLTRSASFSGQLPRAQGLERPEGRMRRSNSTGNLRAVEVLPIVTPSKQQIGTAFGIGTSELAAGPSSLKDGQALLNQDFSRWDLSATAAKANTTYSGLGKTLLVGLKSIWNFVFSGSQLVTDAKANQELLKNPVLATDAISYLAGLRAKGVTVDVSQYRDDKLVRAKGTEVDLMGARTYEEAFIDSAAAFEERVPENMRKKLQGPADIFASRQTSIAQLEAAMNAISALAPSFDAQRQMVAAVTHNIAMQAGIITPAGEITNQEGMNFLVDQMSSLWIQSAPVGDNATPYAVTKFADKIATNFDANKPESFGAIYDDVRAHAQLFAEASLTEKPGEEVDAEEYDAAVANTVARFETQIWDSLKANDTFKGKMKSAVQTITTEHTRLHNYALTTDTVAETVVESFQQISESNRGNQSGEEFFRKQLGFLGTRMPNEMFSILKGFTSEEVGAGTQTMSLERLHAIDPSLARVGGSMSASELLTAMEIDETADGSDVTFDEAGGDIYAVLAGYDITTDENGANITGMWNKQFTPETLAATLTRAGWHQTEVQRLVSNFDPDTRTVAPHKDNATFTTAEALQDTLENAGIPADQAQVITANFDPATQMVDTSAVVKDAKGSAALPKEMVPSNVLLAEVVRNHTSGDPAEVDVFAVFTDLRLLEQRAVDTETERGEGCTEAEAKAALFDRWVGYSNGGIMGQYQNALDFMRVEDAPSTRALEHYNAAGKQEEINALSGHLAALRGLATQGTVSEELRAARLAGEETQALELQDAYAQTLGLIATRDIDTDALEGRFNLQTKDYYSMLSKALGLREAGTTGSATLTRELLNHLKAQDEEEGVDANSQAAYLLITEGKISWNEYMDLYASSQAVKDADARVMEMLDGITSDAHGIDTISMTLRGLEEGVTLARFTDQVGEFRTYLQDTAQPALTQHMAEVQTPIYMIDNDNVDGLVAAANTLGVPVLAQMIIQAINPSADEATKAHLLANIQGDLSNLAVPEQRVGAAAHLKGIVEASRLPREALVVDQGLLGQVLGEEEAVILDVEEDAGIDAEALIARLGEGQVAVARDLAATALGRALTADDDQLVADISLQLTLLRQEDTREAARVQLGVLLNQG